MSALTILSDPKGDPPKLSEARSKRRASLKENRGHSKSLAARSAAPVSFRQTEKRSVLGTVCYP